LKESAGTLLYRGSPSALEVLIVHPSGAYNRRAPWSIPKGEPEANERLEDAAHRETVEETGVTSGPLTSLGSVTYRKSRKRIHGYAGEPAGGEARVASWEVDAVRWTSIVEARKLLHPDQTVFLDRLVEHLADFARADQTESG